MPRFGTKSLLIVFALLALWLSTFTGFRASADVRRSMLLLILVAATFAAVYGRGRRRAFWTGFASVMFLCGGLNLQNPLHRYVPDFAWRWSLGMPNPATSWQGYAPPSYYTPAPIAPVQDPSAPSPPMVYSSPPAPVYISPVVMPRRPAWDAFAESLTAAWTLGLSSISGLIAVYLFSWSTPAASNAAARARQIVEQELLK